MNLPILTREQVRQVDQRAIEQLGMSGLVLMENAGRGAVDIVLQQQLPEPYLICCGKGNNAGDGFVIARHLMLREKSVRVLMWTDPTELEGDAATNYQILSRCQVPLDTLADDPTGSLFVEAVHQAGTIIDAMLGTGATGDPRAPFDQIIELLNATIATRVAIDLPSGLDCDTGEPGQPTFRADHTVTFVAAKPGLVSEQAREWVGKLHVSDIGVPVKLVAPSS